MKLTKNKIIGIAIVIMVLAIAFWWGGNAPGLQGFSNPADSVTAEENTVNDDKTKDAVAEVKSENDVEAELEEKSNKNLEIKLTEELKEKSGTKIEERPGGTEGNMTADEKLALAAELAGGSSKGVKKGDADYSVDQGMEIDKSTGKDKFLTDPVPKGKPVPVEPQNAVISDKEMTCTMSIKCDTILDNIKWLDPEKVELVPEDGVIFARQTVKFYEGESVFNILLRECKKNKIHMEYVNTPIYNSAYIEGIHNLYEFDCGELSGWMYKVNDWFPNYGCSRYQLKEGDIIEWVYTCDLGVDVGGYYSLASE